MADGRRRRCCSRWPSHRSQQRHGTSRSPRARRGSGLPAHPRPRRPRPSWAPSTATGCGSASRWTTPTPRGLCASATPPRSSGPCGRPTRAGTTGSMSTWPPGRPGSSSCRSVTTRAPPSPCASLTAGRVATNVVKVAAGAVTKADVPVVANSWTAVDVSVDGRGTVADLTRQACGSMVLDPRAVFGVVDCDDVSAPVILDNSRTTARVRFHLPGQDVVLGPGQARSLRVHLPIRERLAVRVDDVLARGRPVERAVVSTARCAGAPTQPRTQAAGGGAGPGAAAAPGGAQAGTAGTTGPAAKDSRPPVVLGF